MKNRRFSALAVIAALFIICQAAAFAEIPHIISYSGRLTDSSGNAVTTAKTLSFKIYDAQTAGTAIWTSGSYSVTPDSNGVFSVLLGTQSDAIGATVFDDTTRYLEIIIESTALTPRLRLVAGPYAFRALTADNVADGAITRAKVAGGNFVKQIVGGSNVSVTGDEGGGTGAVTINASVPGALGGTVTTLESGPGLSGGPITVSGTLSVRYDDSTIGLNGNSSLEVKAGSIGNTQIGTITTAGKVSGNAITSGTIGGTTAINTSGLITSTATIQAASFVGSGAGLSGVTSTSLDGQPGSYYLSRANHTGTQADSTLDTITTPGKVSGSSITSGTIGGTVAINTTGVVTATAFSGSGVGLSGVTADTLGGQSGSYYLNRTNHTGTQDWNTISTATNKVNLGTQVTGSLPGSAISGDINTTGVVTATAFSGSGAGLSGVTADTLNSQPGSYYLNRANHTGTQADSTLDTITTPGKVSGSAITSGTIGGTTAINTTGIVTAAAFSGSGVGLSGITASNATSLEGQGGSYYLSRTNHTGTQDWNTISTTTNKVNLGSQVTGSLPGSAIAGDINTTGVVTAAAFSGSGVGLSGVTGVDSTKVLKAGDTMTGTLTLEGASSKIIVAGSVEAAGYTGTGTNLTNLNASNVASGTLAVARGGTGQAGYSTGDILYASGATTLTKLALGTAGQVLSSRGGIPSWEAVAGTGTVDEVSTGKGLTGGPITTTGMLSIDSTVVTLTDTQTLSNKTFSGTTTMGLVSATTISGEGSGITGVTASNSSQLGGQAGSYYLARANHTGTQSWSTISTTVSKVDLSTQVTGNLPDSNLATIGTPGKVSGSAITSGTIGGTTSISTAGDILTTGTITAAAFVGNGAGITGLSLNASSLEGQAGSYYRSRANHTGTQDWNTVSTAVNKVDLASQVTGQLPDTNLAVIFQSGKVSGDAITAGTIGGTTSMNTTGVLTAAAFSGTFLGTASDSSRLGGNLPSYYATAANLTAHTGASASVHGVTGSVVGTTDIQTISNKTFTGTLTADAFSGNGAGLSSITAANSVSLEGQSGSFYLSRANHTGTQDWNTISTATNKVDLTSQVTGQLPNANLATIDTAGKVSGGAITSGTIGGTAAVNTTGVGTFDAVLASRVSGTLLTTQNWNLIDTSTNKVNLGTQVTGTLPDWNLATIGTPGKIDGGAITSGIIGGTTAINTTGVITAAAFSGPVINAGSVSGPKFKITPEGGYAVLLTNGEGSPVTKGNTVRAKNGVADSFVLTTSTTSTDCIGVVYNDSISDNAEGYIVVSGIAEVQFATTTAPGKWVLISSTAGRADGDQDDAPNTTARWQGIGHSIGTSVGGGALAKVVLHFN